nr:immunoglobulin light chain junction region [Macaca mulatta]
CMQALDLPLTF